jgi:hypothetical protein
MALKSFVSGGSVGGCFTSQRGVVRMAVLLAFRCFLPFFKARLEGVGLW